jgi:DNA-binding XRE family transcriptional regulator
MAGRGDLVPSGFGERLRVVREGKELTQKQLGDLADVHPNTIAKLERGDQEPNWPLVLKLAKALSVTCESFSDALPVASEETADGKQAGEEKLAAKPATKKPTGKKGKK